MRWIIALCRSATQPSVKKVALAPLASNNASRRSTLASTRDGILSHAPRGTACASASTWKYSSTSTVSALTTRPSRRLTGVSRPMTTSPSIAALLEDFAQGRDQRSAIEVRAAGHRIDIGEVVVERTEQRRREFVAEAERRVERVRVLRILEEIAGIHRHGGERRQLPVPRSGHAVHRVVRHQPGERIHILVDGADGEAVRLEIGDQARLEGAQPFDVVLQAEFVVVERDRQA